MVKLTGRIGEKNLVNCGDLPNSPKFSPRQSFVLYGTLVLTIIRATHAVSFIHSSLVNPQSLLSITMLLARDRPFNYALIKLI